MNIKLGTVLSRQVAKEVSNEKTQKYKNGVRTRTDVSVPFTRHDMRRAFNLEAKNAGMSLDDRALILGHSKEVNEAHYRGSHEFDADKIAEFVNSKMSGKSQRLKIVS